VRLDFRCLGVFALAGENRWTSGFSRAHGREFLQYLVAHPRRSIARSVLFDSLWPDLDAAECAHRLHLAVSGARSALRSILSGVNPIVCVNGAYGWRPGLDIGSDVEQLAVCYRDGSIEAMERGVRGYSGEFLAGETAEWILPLRIRYEHMYVAMLERLALAASEAGDIAAATEYAFELAEADPAHEGAARMLMRCFAKSGRRTSALAQYDKLLRFLDQRLSVKPLAETEQLRDRIIAGDLAGF
jgi:DNA-binding SARP family transcriptional activator